jgi:protein subunit release factor A
MNEKVQRLLSRLQEVEALLGRPEILSDQKTYRQLTQEHSQLSELKESWDRLRTTQKQLQETKELASSEKDGEMLSLLKQEIASLEEGETRLAKQVETLLVPPDPRDSNGIILELRAGTGGDEAALFVADCARMYQYYAGKKGWKCEVLSSSPSELGGYKEYIMSMSGLNVHRLMQYEAGVHRVQRVPETETQGRVHTSAITIAVLLEPAEDEEKISRLIPTVHPAQEVSTSTEPTRRCASPTFQRELWSHARKSGASTKTKTRRCVFSRAALQKRSGKKRMTRGQLRAQGRWDREIDLRESAPITFLKTG